MRSVSHSERILANYVAAISDIGLTVSSQKTVMMLFGTKKCMDGYIVDHGVVLDQDRVFPGHSLKYLGVFIDKDFKYSDHIKVIVEKAMKYERWLSCLMPNIRGPNESRWKLYAHAIFYFVRGPCVGQT